MAFHFFLQGWNVAFFRAVTDSGEDVLEESKTSHVGVFHFIPLCPSYIDSRSRRGGPSLVHGPTPWDPGGQGYENDGHLTEEEQAAVAGVP